MWLLQPSVAAGGAETYCTIKTLLHTFHKFWDEATKEVGEVAELNSRIKTSVCYIKICSL